MAWMAWGAWGAWGVSLQALGWGESGRRGWFAGPGLREEEIGSVSWYDAEAP